MNQVECPFTKGQLEFMYWNKGYSLNEIAGISRQKGIAVTDFTVGSWLKRNEIPIRIDIRKQAGFIRKAEIR